MLRLKAFKNTVLLNSQPTLTIKSALVWADIHGQTGVELLQPVQVCIPHNVASQDIVLFRMAKQ